MDATQRERQPSRTEEEEPSRDAPREVSLDEAFTLLRNERRRAVLHRLRTVPTTTIGELADHVAAAEADTTRECLRSKDRKRVYISLYQSHLPVLADAGVIAYDRDRGDVERLPPADTLDRQLDRFHDADSDPVSDPALYAGVAVGAVVVAGALGAPLLGTVPPMWWTVVGVGTLGTLAVAARTGTDLVG